MSEDSAEREKADDELALADAALTKHLAIYNKERTGLSIWRAYAIFRQKGLPVPEQILSQLDLWAARLEEAGKHREIADAIDMTADNGHVKGAKRLSEVEQTYEIAHAVEAYMRFGRLNNSDAASLVAQDTGLSFSNVRAKYFDWKSPTASVREHGKKPVVPFGDEAAGLDLAKGWMASSPVTDDSEFG